MAIESQTSLAVGPSNTTAPSLLIGCTVKEKKSGKIVPAMLVYSIDGMCYNSSTEPISRQGHKSATKNNTSLLSTSSLFPSLEEGEGGGGGGKESDYYYNLLHELESDEESMKKFLSFDQKSTSQVKKARPVFIQCVFVSDPTNIINSHSRDSTTDQIYIPLVTNIIPLSSNDQIAVTVTTAMQSKAGPIANGNQSTILVYNLEKINERSTGINVEFVKEMEFSKSEDSIKNLISFTYGEEKCLLSCLTCSGTVKVFSIGEEEGIKEISRYEATNVHHLVYCNNGSIGLITDDGNMEMLDIHVHVHTEVMEGEEESVNGE